jgi:hypothetical protein
MDGDINLVWASLTTFLQDKLEVHIRYDRGGETKCVAANEGGEIFDQRPFFDF